MTTKSKIEWTELTWNPTVGCTKISSGCKHCYAEVMARRLKAMGVRGYENGFKLTLLPERLDEPRHRNKSAIYFVNSMSDLFHENVPFSYIDRVFDTIRNTHHTYQILTKRAARMAKYFSVRSVPRNAWLGVTVEDKKAGIPRIDHLRNIDARVRFISFEPLLENLGDINLHGIAWAIVGGESGPKARPMEESWVRCIQRQCSDQGVAFFFKQWGAWGQDGIKRPKKLNGRLFDGRTWDGLPELV